MGFNLCVGLFLTLLLAGPPTRAQENFLFLNFGQYQSLTEPEQKRYLDQLQTLIVRFEAAADFHGPTSFFSPARLLWAQILPSAQALTVSPTREVSVHSVPEENQKIGSLISYLRVFQRAYMDRPTTELKERLVATSNEIYNRLKNVGLKSFTAKDQSDFNVNLQDFKIEMDKAVRIRPELDSLRRQLATLRPLKTTPSATKKTAESIRQRPSSQKTPMTPSPAEAAAGGPDAVTAPYCLYAGFVISERSCTPFKILPDSLRLSELGDANFKCANEKEILCNPLVFGYQADLTPYCTVRSVTASKNCQHISNNKENKNRLHIAWKNPTNKKLFDDYHASLTRLCEGSVKSSDVIATCKVVVTEFNEMMKKEFSGSWAQSAGSKPAQPTADPRKTNKSLRTN